MNKLVITGAALTVAVVSGLAVAGSVSAAENASNGQTKQYGQQRTLEVKAKTLGVSVDELRGKNWKEIAQQKGVSEQAVQDALRQSAQERWKANGLSEEEIQQRLADMEKRQANCDGTGENAGGQHGYGRGVHRQ